MRYFIGLLLCLVLSISVNVRAATTDLTGSTSWTALFKSDRFDPLSDTQAQKAGTEIVGNSTHTSFFFNYDDSATVGNLGDDILSLRIRIGDETKSTHSAYVFFGIDANSDGKLDIFISSGAGNTALWLAGSSSNTSPSTTSLANSAYKSYVQNSGNYDFALVSVSNDPDWDGNDDLNTDNNTDVFISFSVPVTDLAALLQTLSITFTDSTPLRFVSLSATQTNSLNSDFNGVGNSSTDNWNSLFTDLGILSDPVTTNGVVDTTPPLAPTVVSQVTNDTTPVITGSFDAADAAGGFTVTVNGVTYSLNDGNLSASGNTWSLQIPSPLPEATYEVIATATDADGNSASDTSSNELIIDLTDPTIPTVNSQTTNTGTPTITGSFDANDAAGGFSVTVNGVTYTLGDGNLSATGNNWSLTIPSGDSLAQGTYEVTATATDAAGNTSTDISNNELIINFTAPATPTVASQITSDSTPVITGTFDSAKATGGFTVTVNGVTYSLNDGNLSAVGDNWTLYIPAGNPIPNGTYDVTATMTDGGGNDISDTSSNELIIGTDTDGDGIIDSIDLDDDNDGIPDTLEGNGLLDKDNDGIPDSLDLDSDNDGLSDIIESGVSNPYLLDTDNDGRIDSNYSVGNNGLANIVETSNDSGSLSYNVVDTDGDGVEDFRDLDSDNDGIPDVTESGGSDPDGDGITGTGTPTVDPDGLPSAGGLSPVDTDGDGQPDFRDLDSDNDGIKDITEAGGTDNDNDGKIDNFVDNDGDGFDDSTSVSPLPLPDSDMDGIPDYQEVDGVPSPAAIRTGVRGIGGCTMSTHSTGIDPTLYLLLLVAAIISRRNVLRRVISGRK